MSILIKGMDMLKDGTYTSNIHVKDGKAILDNPIGLGYFELVEVVHGEWILNDDQVYECKDCGYIPSFDGYTYYNYCPNCGAYMRGGTDELHK